MGFAGMDSEKDRADLIAYLISLSQSVPKTTAHAAAPQTAATAGDAAAGKESAMQMCAMCHSFDKGGPAMIGPDLYGVVGRAPGHADGFSYSPGVTALGGVWDLARLDLWLANPRAMVADTRMAFPGVPSDKDRANIVAFLATLSDKASK
jgi:cytochrome c